MKKCLDCHATFSVDEADSRGQFRGFCPPCREQRFERQQLMKKNFDALLWALKPQYLSPWLALFLASVSLALDVGNSFFLPALSLALVWIATYSSLFSERAKDFSLFLKVMNLTLSLAAVILDVYVVLVEYL